MPFPKTNVKPRLCVINRGHPLVRGLVFDAPFFEGAGALTEDDLIPDLQLAGVIAASGATWDKNLYGIDLDFSAAASAVTYTTPASVNGLQGGPMSIETLQYQRGTGGGGFGRLAQKATTNAPEWFLYAGDNSSSDLGFEAGFTTAVGDWSWVITQNVWSHCVLTYDGSNLANVPKFYLNTIPQTQEGAGSQPTGSPRASTTSLTIGNRPDAIRNYNGKILYFRIWNRILTPKEVYDLYTNPFRIYMTYPIFKRQNRILSHNSATVAVAIVQRYRSLLGIGQ